MKFNFRKIKHLYILYGLINTFLVFVLLLIVFLFYRKHDKLQSYNKIISNEVINIYHYKDYSKSLAYKQLISNADILNVAKHEQIGFITEINQSRSNINIINTRHSINELHFKEDINGLVIDYEDLADENQLLFRYLNELGDNSQGLFFRLGKAAASFKNKIKDFGDSSSLNTEFNHLITLIDIFADGRNEYMARIVELKIKALDNKLHNLQIYGDNYMITRLLDAFRNFEDSYFEFAKKAHEIGLSDEKGLLSKLNSRYSKISLRLKQAAIIIESEKEQSKNATFVTIGIMIFIVIAFNLIAISFFIKKLNSFNLEMGRYISSLSKGIVDKIDYSKTPVEMHSLLNNLEEFSNKLIKASNSAEAFANGRTSIDIKKEEQLGVFYDAYIKIKQNIDGLNQRVREEQKKQTNMLWIKSGIDKLSDVMRREYDNPLLHANEIINMLVKFLNIPIGAIYHLKEEGGKKYVEMMASFAYGKEKQLYKKIAFGEGIVGTCASERKTLNITNIPGGYFKIISGFGEAKPKNILVSPIKLNEEIYGVIELASLTRFKQEEIDFVEEVCKTVAYSFAISKVYLDTLYLFENSNMEMAQLEAENNSLTNDYEDLNNNYKLMIEQASDNAFVIEKLSEIAIIIDLDLDGNILEANTGFEQFFKSAKMKLLRSNFREYMMEINISDDIDLEYIWKDVRAGIQHEIYQKVELANNVYVLQEHYLPVKDQKGRVKKVKLIAFDITDKLNIAALQ